MKPADTHALKSAWKSRVVQDKHLDPNNVLFGIECEAVEPLNESTANNFPKNKQQIDANCILFGIADVESTSPPPCKSFLERSVVVKPSTPLPCKSGLERSVLVRPTTPPLCKSGLERRVLVKPITPPLCKSDLKRSVQVVPK